MSVPDREFGFCSDAQLYCLVIRHREQETLEVGALGAVDWPSGWTYYVGRARRGWASRMKRFTKSFTNHWHVDYLVSSARARCRQLAPVRWPAERECDLVAQLKRLIGGAPLTKGFGSSDCESGCEAHGWWGDRPPGEVFPDLVGRCPVEGWIDLREDRCRWQPAPLRTPGAG